MTMTWSVLILYDDDEGKAEKDVFNSDQKYSRELNQHEKEGKILL